jgi:ParB/RepB/Spo0J family partition protein
MEEKNIPLDELHDSPFQKKKTSERGNIAELAESIKSGGLLHPLVVRSLASGYEIVTGHRRRLAMARLGMTHATCRVAVMSDEEVRQAILIENGQREGVPPLEELSIYEGLRKDGLEIEEIAAKIGRPTGYVYRRLQLQDLCADGKKALADGTLRLVVAEMIARLNSKAAQAEAVQSLAGTDHSGPASASQARSWIQRQGTLALKDADFDIDDANLISTAPACSACQKNTSGTMLFPDLEEALCTFGECFQKKRDAAWVLRRQKAIDAGRKVIEGDDLSTVFDQWGHRKTTWADLNKVVWVGQKSKKLRTVIGAKALKGMQVSIVRTPDTGTVLELVRMKDVKEAVADRPDDDLPYEMRSGSGKNPMEAKHKREKAIQREVSIHLGLHVASAISGDKLPHGMALWKMLAEGVAHRAWSESVKDALNRRKVELIKSEHGTLTEETASEWIHGKRLGLPVELADEVNRTDALIAPRPATLVDLEIFVIECMLAPELAREKSAYRESVLDTLGIDIKEVQATAKAEVKRREKEKADKKKASVKRKAERLKKAIADCPEKAVACSVCEVPIGKPCKSTDDHPVDKKKSHTKRFEEAKVASPRKSPTKTKDPTPEVMKLIDGGMSQTAVAADLGLSRGQVSRIVKKARATA